MQEIAPPYHKPHAKVTVVGAGQVGMAAAFSMMTQVGHFTAFNLTSHSAQSGQY